MRWLLLLIVCVWSAPIHAAVRADEVDPTTRPATVQPALVTSVPAKVEVAPFEVRGDELPQWLGRSLQRSVQEELESVAAIELVQSDSATVPAKTADYRVIGRSAGSQLVLEVNLDVIHLASQTRVHSVKVMGRGTDVLQIKAALREQIRELFSPPDVPAKPQPEPRVASAPPATASSSAGSQFAGSDLEWALDNPDTFASDLAYYGRRNSSATQWPYGYGYYGPWIAPGSYYISRPPYACPATSMLQIRASYHSGGLWGGFEYAH